VIYRTFARYVLATGVPAAVNFLALTIYSRLLTPAAYGTYSLVLATVGVANALAFQWIRAAARRYLPEDATRAELLAALRRVYAVLIAAAALGTVVFAIVRPELRLLAALGLGLLVVQAWFELNLEILLADLQPGRYGVMTLSRALAGLAIGVVLVRAGFGAFGVLMGQAVGYLLPAAWATPRLWRGLPGADGSGTRVMALARYGLPLTAGYALQFVVDFSDRFLLGALRSVDEVGGYAVSYDLAAQSLTLLCMMVNLAAYPIALRALREHGATAARSRLREQAAALMGLTLPALVGITVLAPALARTLLGSAFHADATRLMPIVALGVFFGGFKAYYFDTAFHFGERTSEIVRVGVVAGLLNIGLNLAWIPRHGADGAAWATVVAYVVACGVSAWRGRAVFALPLPWVAWLKVALVAALMGAAIWPLRQAQGWVPVLGAVGLGGIVYGAGLLLLDVERLRSRLRAALQPSRAVPRTER